MRVSATCGQKERGQSRLSGPLFQEIQGENSGGEEKSEVDMSEERNAEGGEIKIYVRDKDKNNCTTHETSLVSFISVVFSDLCNVCLPTNKQYPLAFHSINTPHIFTDVRGSVKGMNPSYQITDEEQVCLTLG